MRIAAGFRHGQPGFCRKIAPALDVIPIMTVARSRRRQQDNTPRRRHLPRVRDGILHGLGTMDFARDIVPPARDYPRQRINPLSAVAEADDSLCGACDGLFDELGVIDTAVVPAKDDRYVA